MLGDLDAVDAESGQDLEQDGHAGDDRGRAVGVQARDLAAVRVGRSFRVPERAVQDYLRDAYTDIA